MRIGIDARSILNPERKGGVGVGHYTYHLLKNLQSIDKENEYVVFFDSTVRKKDIEKFNKDNFSVRFFPYEKYGRFLPSKYKDIMLSGFLNRENLDILHIFGLYSALPAKFNGKIVFAIRGVGSLKYPELYPADLIRKAKAIKNAVKENFNNLHIITSSENLKDDASGLLDIPKEKITTIYEGMDRRLCEAITEEDVNRIKKKYNLGNHGILCMGTIEPSKNIPRILESYKRLREKTGYYYKMVIAGKDGWMAAEIKQIAKDLGILDDVEFTGYITPEDLSALFKACCMFVFVPLYEGFGNPLIEALACGKPVIASDVGALREVMGNNAIYVDPRDIEGISNAMIKVLNDKRIGKNASENNAEKIKNFCWERCARETLSLYEKITNQ